MPFRRRRPLLRTAVVGGGAYMAGKHMANAILAAKLGRAAYFMLKNGKGFDPMQLAQAA